MKTRKSLLKIVVCDDDPADRKLARLYLRQIAGPEIVIVEAGEREEIESALYKGRVDLVLMDIDMPEKSGTEWLAEIVKKQLAPVVMLTGAGSEEMAVQSLRRGAAGYLSKTGLSPEKLGETIESALEQWRRMQQSKADQEELERLANIDSLTGLQNRRAILRRLEEQIKYAKRYREEFSLVMLDIDHFKQVNDRYGHLVGDDVLERLGWIVRENIRGTDSAGRYGGEEFIVILARCPLSAAVNVAERIRQSVEAARMEDSRGRAFGITVSQGLAAYREGDGAQSLIARADEAMYRAKENGRNRVESSD